MVLQRCIPQATVNHMLQILRKHGRTDLPRDCRSLINTPRNASKNIESASGGKYKHLGLVSDIIRSLKTYFKILPLEIKINIIISMACC